MEGLTIKSVYTKQDDQIPGYLVVVFETNKGFYRAGYGCFEKVEDINPASFTNRDLLEDLKNKYGVLEIVDLRVTYDNEMQFLVSGKFILVLGYTLSSETEHSINEFWLEEDIHSTNKNALFAFLELERIT